VVNLKVWMAAVVAFFTTKRFGGDDTATTQPSDLKPIDANLPLVSMSDLELTKLALRRETLGILHLPTGRIVVSDVLVYPDREPLTRSVSPGNYPVLLYRLNGSDPRVALAELRLAEGNPVEWQLALVEGQNLAELENDSYYGFPVDAGVGAFFDISALSLMDRRDAIAKEKNQRANYYDNVLASEMVGDKED
jgi:hypothetical protein